VNACSEGVEEGLKIDERAAKDSEMIRMGLEADESGSVSRCSKQLKIFVACTFLVNKEAVLRR